MTIVIGNNLNLTVVEVLKDREKISIRFELGKMTDLAKRVESKLRAVYGTEGLPTDYDGNRIRYEGRELRCESHDCSNEYCKGLGETYYVSGKELQKFAN